MGVVFNNTVVPFLGWNAMFAILGCFTAISLIMLFFFTPVKSTFIPFDDDRDYFYSVEPDKKAERAEYEKNQEGVEKKTNLRK